MIPPENDLSHLPELTEIEKRCLALAANGKTPADIVLETDLAMPRVCEAMRSAVDKLDARNVTGAITRAIVDHGIAGNALLVLELNEELHAHLRRRFANELLVLGDAVELPRLASEAGFLDAGPADAVISGLGLLAMERELVTRILRSAFACLRADGRFIQFTYGPVSPVSDAVLDALGLRMRRGDFVLRNVPPATVYVYERANPAG